MIDGVGGNSSRNYQQMAWHNFAPRLGVAYQITPKTVLRTGYGWAYSAGWAGSIFNEANITLPVLGAIKYTRKRISGRVWSCIGTILAGVSGCKWRADAASEQYFRRSTPTYADLANRIRL